MLVDIFFGVLHRDGPLLVPPVRLRQDAAVHHGEPVVRPDVFVHVVPVAMIADALRIKQQRAVGARAVGVGYDAVLADDVLVPVHQFAVELVQDRRKIRESVHARNVAKPAAITTGFVL